MRVFRIENAEGGTPFAALAEHDGKRRAWRELRHLHTSCPAWDESLAGYVLVELDVFTAYHVDAETVAYDPTRAGLVRITNLRSLLPERATA